MERDGGSGKFLLKKAVDLTKDQSYMLYVLPREALSEILFPLGGLTKAEVREIARINGFDNADKKESQDICFIPDGNHAAFIERYTGRFCAPGDFVDTQGNILGRHGGITRYTVGQRKGLGIALQKPVFVREKDAKTNRVVLCESGELFSKSLEAGDFNWLVPETPASFRASARVRYHQAERPCAVTVVSKDTVRIDFDEPQRAIAMGQAVVLYDGDAVLGGGTIK
jgi:tRNA-specific 2-thiouridylase